MTPAQDLFRLIQSLTKNEKRYFKVFSSLHSDKDSNNYRKLFDAIARQKAYDEPLIRRELKGQIKSFTVTKHHLYHLILKGLRVYHSRSTANSQLYSMLQNIEILFEKALYPECKKMIRQAQEVATLYQHDLAMVELLNWEARVAKESGYKKTTKQNINNLHREELLLLERYRNICKSRNVHDQIFRMHYHQVYARNERTKKEFSASVNPALLHDKQLPQSAKINLCFAYMAYFRTIGNLRKSHEYCRQIIRIIETSPQLQQKELQKQYVNALISTSITLGELHRHKESNDVLQKIRAIHPKNDHIAITVFSSTYYIELNFLLATGQFEKATRLATTVETGLQQYKGKISSARYIELCYAMAYAFFGAGNYTQAITWCNKILNYSRVDIRIDLFAAAYILHLMTHIEKGNWNLIRYLDNSARGFLLKKKYLHLFEKTFLDFVHNKLSNVKSPAQISAAFKEFKPNAEKLLKDPFEQKILNYIDFREWIESKMQDRPFAEVVKESVKKLKRVPG